MVSVGIMDSSLLYKPTHYGKSASMVSQEFIHVTRYVHPKHHLDCSTVIVPCIHCSFNGSHKKMLAYMMVKE